MYFNGKPIGFYSGGGWTDYVYGPTGLLLEVQGTQAGVPAYRMTDHLGSLVGNLNAAGTATCSQDVAPFGEIFAGSCADGFVFTGKQRDAETGNDNFGARYYGSSMGRFMSPDWTETPDPIPYADLQNPQSLNLYEYVLNNPLAGTDPDGHKCDGGSTGPDGVFTVHCTTDRPKMDDGRINPGDNGLGLIAGYGIGKLAGMGVQSLLALRGAGEAVGLLSETSSATINITEDGLEHVMQRHVVDGAKTAGKSLFKGSKEEVKTLIQKAGSVKPTTQAGGNLERVIDAGRTIGTDRATNSPTSVYTVITRQSGDLVTAFPGRP